MDVHGGQLTQSNLNPVFPGTHVTGPLLAGNIKETGGPALAGLGSQSQNALGNVGYAKMVQVGRITQAASPGGAAGVFTSPDLIIPAQSMILSTSFLTLTPWNGAVTTFNVGTATNPTLFGTGVSGAANASAPALPSWANVGNQDVQMVFTSANTGAGAALAVVEYVQGLNAPTS
jgi:hypothetical protein